ncbi:MAG: hypothetical protein KC635_02785, partial [Myxococcales bacterium]|nr:hypothetical protein [Myxococcales bacterium]
MTRLPKASLIALLIVAGGPSPALGARGKKGAEAVDHLALAALLVRDGHPDRAEVELAQVPLDDPATDLKLVWRLRGFIALDRQAWREAAEALEQA